MKENLPENRNPVSDLMAGLGIDSGEATNSDVDPETAKNELTDSDAPTLEEDGESSETLTDTDTASEEGDTDTISELETLKAELEALKKESEISKKRISDKDKFINELQGKQKQEDGGDEGNAQDLSIEGFWDDPEKNFKMLVDKMEYITKVMAETNFRVDENVYAQSKSDYYSVVNKQTVDTAMKEDPDFVTSLQSSDNKFEYAYNYLKGRVDNKTKAENKIRQEEREKLMKEFGISKDGVKKPTPSINNIGSSNSSRTSSESEDGFASVFGY
jgi:hypothetical protein